MTAYLVGDCCCKCCVTLRYRVWLIGKAGSLGTIAVFEWQVSQGLQVESGEDNFDNQGVTWYAGDYMFHNATDIDKSPFYFTDEMAARMVWITQTTGYIETRAQCNTIRWRPGLDNPFCPKESGVVELFGEDSWTESIYIQTGTSADLPATQEWDTQAAYKYGYSDWHQVELCET